MNYLVFCDVQHVQSSILGQNMMFGSVRSSVLLLCDQTSLGTYSLMFVNCSVFCDVQHVQSSIFGQNVMLGKFDISLMFRHSMFGVFEVWYFGVHSKTTRLILMVNNIIHLYETYLKNNNKKTFI